MQSPRAQSCCRQELRRARSRALERTQASERYVRTHLDHAQQNRTPSGRSRGERPPPWARTRLVRDSQAIARSWAQPDDCAAFQVQAGRIYCLVWPDDESRTSQLPQNAKQNAPQCRVVRRDQRTLYLSLFNLRLQQPTYCYDIWDVCMCCRLTELPRKLRCQRMFIMSTPNRLVGYINAGMFQMQDVIARFSMSTDCRLPLLSAHFRSTARSWRNLCK